MFAQIKKAVFWQLGRFCCVPAIAGVFLVVVLMQTALHSQSIPELIFVQIPVSARESGSCFQGSDPVFYHYVEGARIMLLTGNKSHAENLTPEFWAACDPDIAFDGKSIIFSGKREADDHWQIWRMNPDGSEKEQITYAEGDCLTPVHAGNRFYLEDPQPTPQIIYAGNEHGWSIPGVKFSIFSLYGTDSLGKTIHRLTYNLNNDYGPEVLPNGRIVFGSRQKAGDPDFPQGKTALLAINNDGSDLMPYYGNHEGPVYKEMVHISGFDDRVYFVESDQPPWPGGGNLASLTQTRPMNSYRRLKFPAKGLFHSAVALEGRSLLVSYRSSESEAVFGIYKIRLDDGKNLEGIYAESGWHSIDPHLVMLRPVAKGRSNWLIPGTQTGLFYCLNSYMSNLPELESLDNKTIKFVRVIEGVPLISEAAKVDSQKTASDQFHNNGQRSGPIPLRLLGIAPVEEDGSFQIRVPAGIPINFQLLDKDYMAVVRQQSWIWVMGNESRGCIGCHEDPELSPPNILAEAVVKPAVELTLPPERRRMVDFRHQIAPIIPSACSSPPCHQAGKTGPDLSGRSDQQIRKIYDFLLNEAPVNPKGSYVIPGSARNSPLIGHLMGKQPDGSKYKFTIHPIPESHSMKPDEKILFIEWIDLGAVWDNQSNHIDQIKNYQ